MASLIKFKIRFLDGLKRDEFKLMEELSSVTPLNIKDIFLTGEGAVANVGSYQELENLLTDESTNKLSTLKLKVTPYPDYKSECTVFIPKVKHFISNSPAEHLIHQINESNTQIKACEVVYLKGKNYKQGDRMNLKIVFATPSNANLIFSNGLSIGIMNIEPQHIFKEEYIHLNQCFRCFAFDHVVRDCPAPSPTCSTCSGTHHFKTCTNKNKILCCLCGGNHIAVSHQCPVRKKVLVEIRKQKLNPDSSDKPSAKVIPKAPITDHNSNTFPTLPDSKPNAWTPKVLQTPQTLTGATSAQGDQYQNHHSQPPKTPKEPSQQSNPQVIIHTPPPSSELKDHEWEIRLDLWKALANRIAGPDHLKYVLIINSFLTQYNLSPIELPDIVLDIINNKPQEHTTSITNPEESLANSNNDIGNLNQTLEPNNSVNEPKLNQSLNNSVSEPDLNQSPAPSNNICELSRLDSSNDVPTQFTPNQITSSPNQVTSSPNLDNLPTQITPNIVNSTPKSASKKQPSRTSSMESGPSYHLQLSESGAESGDDLLTTVIENVSKKVLISPSSTTSISSHGSRYDLRSRNNSPSSSLSSEEPNDIDIDN